MSSAVDEDTVQTVQAGRETIAGVLSSAQTHLQKAFIAFVIGMMGTIWAMRAFVWEFLEANTKSRMGPQTAEVTDIVVRTPFDVILLQVKIGLAVGILFAVPVLLYYGREAIVERADATVPINKRRVVGFAVTSVTLFVGGVIYAYGVFFPYMFEFLASNAVQAGVKPSYGIVEYTEFILLLSLSFGLAAQLPMAMAVLSYTEIVPYETFRDKWKYAVLGIFVFGAVFSPPDPFTQVMWALPLVALYAASLGLSKLITNVKRAGRAADPAEAQKFRRRGKVLVAALVAAFVGTLAFLSAGGPELANQQLLPALPDMIRPAGEFVAGDSLARLWAATKVTAVVGLLGIIYNTARVLRSPVQPRRPSRSSSSSDGPAPASAGDPSDLDLDNLDAAGVRAAPPQTFLSLTEDEALERARTAMDDDHPEKAQAILDRFDEVEAAHDDAESGDGDANAAAADSGDEDDGSLVTGTAAGMMDAFTEDETTEEEIGGYFYDLQFIFSSLTSKLFRIVGLGIAVFVGVFVWLYSGGIGDIRELFLSQVPPELRPTEAGSQVAGGAGEIIALHPVEVLIFEVQVSTILAVVVTLPMILYYAWPALEERGLVAQGKVSRSVFFLWGGCLVGGLIGGSLLGFFVIAPELISYFVADAKAAGMIVSYRLRNFFWLIFSLTIGIGLLANIPVTMLLFARSGVVSFGAMLKRWRVVVLAIFAIAGVATPNGILTMLLFAAPVALAYLLGLGVLWIVTLPGRLRGRGGSPA
ncbi:sec-independent protein translocase protein TatC [Natronoarchaeum philippinense]|uniref:Sec-independent protein translocase protein TatC n=1 Tax=Natronoarchaeum philippinense TaxID=558529 RepID=A0A285P1K8_NATPI|nr:twin-arginine translocase subunit TatC [Natronoarchaeum philippinense]SNZ15609.1 sec-independent protein translocase protein TatC [Natronoarchaeum philippinense]